MIKADCHVHTLFSSDSQTPVRDQIEAARKKGFSHICITDHHDPDFPTGQFQLDFPAYSRAMDELAEEYRGSSIQVLKGFELGLQPHIVEKTTADAKKIPADFIIGSIHLMEGVDPYYPEFWENISDAEGYRRYFELTLECAKRYDCVDVYGHLDYIVRYGKTKNQNYCFSDYEELIREILKTLIQKGIGIECNTGGYRYQLGCPNPEKDLLMTYRELGGEILTMGSDGHSPEYVGYCFDQAEEYLRACGFDYYTVFRNRKPEFYKI